MNRIIKFRGKAIDDGEWLIGDLIHRESNNKSVSNMQIKPFDYGGAYAVDKSTVGQFTGLVDKNGKEIFEGDILKPDLWAGFGVVGFVDASWCIFDNEVPLELEMVDTKTSEMEIYGNIHEHKHLLK